MDLNESKALLRRRLLQQRGSLSYEQVQESSARLCAHILACDAYRRAERIMGYLAFGREISLDSLLRQALADGKLVYVPYIISATEFVAARLYNMDNFTLDRHKIRSVAEPAQEDICAPGELELILVPGVAFSRDGQRLGMGAGYYDRFLAQAAGAVKIGAVYEALLQPSLPAGEFDLTVDMLASEAGVCHCSAG